MSDTSNERDVPRAMIHKRILDAASEKPEASLETLASEIPSATTDLVEQVLDEYGDPTGEQNDGLTSKEADRIQEHDYPDVEELTEKQRETLHAIHSYPDATQRELAEILDVSGATVCNRMIGLEEFDWEERQSFAEAVLDTESLDQETEADLLAPNEEGHESPIDQLADRVDFLEQRVEQAFERDRTGLTDPDLLHKVIQACMESDSITKEEEIQIFREVLE